MGRPLQLGGCCCSGSQQAAYLAHRLPSTWLRQLSAVTQLPTHCAWHAAGFPSLAPSCSLLLCLPFPSLSSPCCRPPSLPHLRPCLQFFRGRQNNPVFQWTNATGGKQPLSFADILVAGAAVAVRQCSGGALNLTITMGRPEATQADDTMLPSPTSVIEDRHNSVFQQMVGQAVLRALGWHATWFRASARPTSNGWSDQGPLPQALPRRAAQTSHAVKRSRVHNFGMFCPNWPGWLPLYCCC